jgi:hypothetical protein
MTKNETLAVTRRAALAAADRSLAIEGLRRSADGQAIGERWARGDLSADAAIAQLVRHYREAATEHKQ